MKFSTAALTLIATLPAAIATETQLRAGARAAKGGKKPKHCGKKSKKQYSKKNAPLWRDNSERLLLREGIIEEIPPSLCTDTENGVEKGKNVILVVGDGMGWEMIRAGAVAKKVLMELEDLGVDTSTGATGATAEAAKAAFAGRTLDDYYTEGRCSDVNCRSIAHMSCMVLKRFGRASFLLILSSVSVGGI
mmetsp:Transcript_8174/g.12124  ORF Transcript_8174/g.12124 Transcript_8174/m.12124 type:complete len:191 (-) Transcript_8174:148-720(-)|eukprot:CAMPEP_0196816074 /NCGR_PEP_ID=MMETSP1362-20130617/53411_1 /TAXON_ID=163516 /ORGANISM="Leptocylindrus danicus, Strain CCMP1856" /LENGTH=190 /DNA_ID=CAMNT_0042193277 /DNA_START=228 /DNA_END=800 /DNA_ORIENTATION=-